jgi:hypothetical protein
MENINWLKQTPDKPLFPDILWSRPENKRHDLAKWADGVLLAGDFGRNSETAVLLENFATKFADQLTMVCDSLNYFLQNPQLLINRPNTTIVDSLSQVQKLAHSQAIRQQDDLVQVLNKLSIFTSGTNAAVITQQSGQIIVALNGQVSTTQSKKDGVGPELAAYASVWRLQQPKKPLEGLTTSIYCYAND